MILHQVVLLMVRMARLEERVPLVLSFQLQEEREVRLHLTIHLFMMIFVLVAQGEKVMLTAEWEEIDTIMNIPVAEPEEAEALVDILSDQMCLVELAVMEDLMPIKRMYRILT